MTKYIITKSEEQIDGTLQSVVYGMECIDDEKAVARIPDISADFKEVSGLVDACNRCELSYVHFKDIVEDFIVLRS